MSLALQFATYKIEFSKASISQNNLFLNIYNRVYPNLNYPIIENPLPLFAYILYIQHKNVKFHREKRKNRNLNHTHYSPYDPFTPSCAASSIFFLFFSICAATSWGMYFSSCLASTSVAEK